MLDTIGTKANVLLGPESLARKRLSSAGRDLVEGRFKDVPRQGLEFAAVAGQPTRNAGSTFFSAIAA